MKNIEIKQVTWCPDNFSGARDALPGSLWESKSIKNTRRLIQVKTNALNITYYNGDYNLPIKLIAWGGAPAPTRPPIAPSRT